MDLEELRPTNHLRRAAAAPNHARGRDAVEAAVALMERQDPDSLEQALSPVPNGAELSPGCREVVAEAWDRYFHIRSMPWD